MTELARLCLYYRAKNDLTQAEMARRCNLDRGIIIDIEHDRTVSKLTEAKLRLVVEGE